MKKERSMTNKRNLVITESLFIRKAKKFLILLAVEIIIAIVILIVNQFIR